jgi:hypothetical protein
VITPLLTMAKLLLAVSTVAVTLIPSIFGIYVGFVKPISRCLYSSIRVLSSENSPSTSLLRCSIYMLTICELAKSVPLSIALMSFAISLPVTVSVLRLRIAFNIRSAVSFNYCLWRSCCIVYRWFCRSCLSSSMSIWNCFSCYCKAAVSVYKSSRSMTWRM